MAKKVKEAKVQLTWKEVKRQKFLLISSALFVIYGFLFYYMPLGGWLMAFQNYKPKDGLLGSTFVGLAKFEFLFTDATFLNLAFSSDIIWKKNNLKKEKIKIKVEFTL